MDLSPENLPLKDIHLPDSVNWWPPAQGWWLLLLLIILFLYASVRLYRYLIKRKQAPLRLARAELHMIGERYANHQDANLLIRELSKFLRKTALRMNSRDAVAALTDEDWLVYLEQGMEDKPFSSGPGRCFRHGPYQQAVAINTEEVLLLCENWIATQEKEQVPTR